MRESYHRYGGTMPAYAGVNIQGKLVREPKTSGNEYAMTMAGLALVSFLLLCIHAHA